MRTLAFIFAAVIACLVMQSAMAQPQTVVTTKRTTYAVIRCEAFGMRQSFCPIDTRRGIRMVADLSAGRCQIGRTWGYNATGIWVAGGCRGEFEIGRGDRYGYGFGYVDDRIVVCASRDYARSFCPANTSRGVRLINQISHSACIRGRTWWRDARGIVVTDGCAGEFEIGYRTDDYRTAPATGAGGPYRPESFVCASSGPRRYCPADVGFGAVSIVERMGSTPCVYGSTWSYDRNGVWVSRGCVARFEVGYPDREWTPAADVSYVRCESVDRDRVVCDARGARDAVLQRQLSRAPCEEGESWGFDRGRIWVDHGCAADFVLSN